VPETYWVRSGRELLQDIDQAAVPPGFLYLWYLGQMSLVIKGAGLIVYIDPYLVHPRAQDPLGRVVSPLKFPPPFAAEEVHHATVVLGTHNHSDHINIPTLKGIFAGSPEARFVVPAPHKELLVSAGIPAASVMEAVAGETLAYRELQVIPLPAAHEELEQDEEGRFVSLCYLIRLNGVTLFHGGDTVEYPGLVTSLREYAVDICFLPINGRDLRRREQGIIGNMNFREAADAGRAAGARLLIPGHYDLFPTNSENPAFFADYLYRTYPDQPFKIMVPGERLVYTP